MNTSSNFYCLLFVAALWRCLFVFFFVEISILLVVPLSVSELMAGAICINHELQH